MTRPHDHLGHDTDGCAPCVANADLAIAGSQLADVWPTDGTAETWTDSRGFQFKLINGVVADLTVPEWGCTVCMTPDDLPADELPRPIRRNDLIFVDADQWPWIDHGQNHPSFIHMHHFHVVNRPSKET